VGERPAAWTGVVLTGGASTRMGRDKALLEVDGRPLAGTVASTLRAAGGAPVLAVGGDAERLAALGIEVLPDLHPGMGPLGGLLTALAGARTEVVVVLACDLPGVDEHSVRSVVRALVADPGLAAAWPVEEGPAGGVVEHVLHGAWRAPAAVEVLRAAFDAGERSVRRAAAGLATREVRGIEPATLRNANRPEDLLGR
jgi:molybdopterin-guanine dinucleotide biosynthesis protein A